jgi:hypothetical protein
LLKSGIIDQNVELSDSLNRFLDRITTKNSFFYVAGNQQTSAIFICDVPGCFFGVRLFRRQINNRYIRAFASEKDGDGASDSRIAAGYQRNLIL